MVYYSDNSGSFGNLKKGFSDEWHRCLAKLKSKGMKLQQILLGAVFFLTACSSPKYAYHFDQYDYNSGKKTTAEGPVQSSPLNIEEEIVVASSDKGIIYEQKTKKIEQKDVDAFVSRYKSMSKAEQKEFRSELKK